MIAWLSNLLGIFDAEALIRNGGLLLVFMFVFAQTGLFFCFFLPSGALMFTAGVFTATGVMPYSLITVCLLLTLAAIAGNSTGYWIGRKTGPLLYKRKDTRFFKQQHLQAAEKFYAKHGALASAGALFFPIIRTFAPLVAGMVKMNFPLFLLYSSLGSLAWITIFTSAGYLIASVPALKAYIGYVIAFIIIVVTIPIVIGIIRKLKNAGS